MAKCKTGDKVRVIKDVKYCDTIKKGDIVEIDNIESNKYYFVKGHKFNDCFVEKYYLIESEFSVLDDKEYIWYCKDEQGRFHILDKHNLLVYYCDELSELDDMELSEYNLYALTTEQASKSVFYSLLNKKELNTDLYCIHMKGFNKYLNFDKVKGTYSMGIYPYAFTEKEADEIIGSSSILYKELIE